jgi:serine phosphatase RsbU (regulator of sigma subunit)/serine/threonine protein kinase/tetratricopeptide (TPR) repeat protein
MLQEQTLIANRYEILSLLGEGGMGQVYRVQDTVTGKECALKVLAQKILSDEALLQFKQEFWFMTRLRHPHIIQVYEYGVLPDGAPYLTMEIVPGQELSDLGQVSLEQGWKILIQAAKALGFIHSRLLVHSDIKPQNLRIRPDGELKLMDFGLMQPLGTRSNGQLTGTVAYMPPEIPQRGEINEASDLYSLGVLAYELFTGVQPFMGTSVLDVIKAHIHSEPPPMRAFRSDIPPALEKIILKLLAKDPADRYPNAGELLVALAEASGMAIPESEEEKLSYLSSHVLVGRDAELNTLKQTLEQLQAGSRSTFVGAPAGVGKSRLIEEFKIHAQLQESPFCQGICADRGMSSYEPMVQALQQVLPQTRPESLLRHGPILAHLLPRVIELGITPAPDFDPKDQKIELFETIVTWLEEVSAQRPLVLFIDDLHWADMATIDLFNYLARGLNDAHVLLLGSFRDDELAGNSPLWQTVEEQLTHMLKLAPFTEAHVAELLGKMLRDVTYPPEFIPYFYGATSGNAFFIREMMRYLLEENLIERRAARWIIPESYTTWTLPTSIGDTIRTRLKRLSPEAIALIEMASVVGKRVPLKLLEQLSGLPDTQLFDRLEELVERQFFLREKDLFLFPHDRVRETLYSILSEAERRPLHQKVALFLEAQGEAASVLAYHFKRGEDTVKAIHYLLLAGDESSVRMESALLMKEALDLLESCPAYPDQAAALEANRRKLAWVSYMIQPFICQETCEKLLASLYTAQVPLSETAQYEGILISSYSMIGQTPKALEKTEQLLAQLEPGTIPYAQVMFGRLNPLLMRGEFRQLVREMEAVATTLKPHLATFPKPWIWTYGFSCFIREDAIAWLGEPVGRDDYKDVPGSLGQQHNFLDLVFWSYYPEVVRNSLIGRYRTIQQVSDEIFALIKKMGRPIQHENRFLVCLAFAAIEFGDLETGENYADKIVALGQRMNNAHQQASGKILQGMIAEARNHLQDAVERFAEALELGRKHQNDQLLPALYRLAGVHFKQGDFLRAETLIAEAHALATSPSLENPYHQIHTWRLKARLLIQHKQAPEAIHQAFQNSLDLALRTENPLQEGHTRSSLATWLIERSDYAEALEHLEQAEKAYMRIAYPLTRVRERLQWVRQQLEQVRPEIATPPLDEQLRALLQPEKAQEIGYRLVDMIRQLNLAQLRIPGMEGDMNTLSERLEKVERVNQFSQLIMKSLDLQMVLNNIMDYVIDIAQADRGILMLVDEKGKLSPQVVRSRDTLAGEEKRLMSFSKSFTARVQKSGQSLWVQDAQADAALSQQASIMAMDLRTLICVPLKREEEVIGLIYLDRQAINQTFSQADLELVESMATFATISLVNARLHAQLQERNDHLQMLNELSREISTSLDFDALLSKVLAFCLKISQGEIGYIFISKDIAQEPGSFDDLECRASLDAQGRPLEEVRVSRSTIGKVVTERTALSIVDMGQEDELLAAQKSVMALDLKSVMSIPIFGKEQTLLGVVYVSSQAVNYSFNERDLALVESIVRQVGMDIENRHLMDIRKRQELLDQELALARNIQSSMLPDYVPEIPNLEMIGYSEPATAVGGDYYDYFKISDYEFGLALGDVNGHGVSASLLMAMAKSCLFVQGKIDPNVLPVMQALNSMIFGGTKERLFMTFVYSIFHLESQTVTLSSAGHHLPYHFSAAEQTLKPIQTKPTYPLGVRENARFTEVTFALGVGDILVYYTDGITEAPGPEAEEFGFERLEQLIITHHHLSAQALQEVILEAYHGWVGPQQEAHDDVTLVVVKVKSPPTNPDAPPTKERQKLKTGFLTLLNR